MQLDMENEKKKLQFYYQLLALTRNNIGLYKSCVYCIIKQVWCVAVITSGNNTMLLEIS